MTSEKAQKFISWKIERLKAEGVPNKQRVAIALNSARERGFKVPLPSHVKKAERES